MTPARPAKTSSDADASRRALEAEVEKRTLRARRLAFVAFGAGATSLILVAVARIFGNPTPWTSWAVSIMLTTNAAVFLIPQARRNLRIATLYFRFSTLAAFVIFAGIIARFWRG
jgi:hypothetical protein